MNQLRWHRLAPVLLAVVALGVIASLPVKIARGDDIASIRVREPVATIVKGVTVSQEFPAKGEEIRSLGLFLSRYGSVTRGSFLVTIDSQLGEQWQPLASESVPIAALRDRPTDPYAFRFRQPLAVTMDQRVRITVQSPEGDATNAIQWWSNPDFTHEGYAARVNGKQQEGILCFTVTYEPAIGRLIQVLGPAWTRATIFLNTGWQVMLLIGLGAIALSFVVIARLLVRFAPAASGGPPDASLTAHPGRREHSESNHASLSHTDELREP